MMPSQPAPELRLEVRRTFPASIERVYDAWTRREQLEQWMCRDAPTHINRYLELNVSPGGRFIIHITTPEGDIYLQHGEFVEVVPQRRLVFKWFYEKIQSRGAPAQFRSPDTLVTVEFSAKGNATEVVLTHARFTTVEERDGTDKGWNGCFDALAAVLG